MTNKQTLELALNALKCLFGLPDKFTGEGGDVAVWRLGGSYRAQEAIKALEEALAKQEQGEPVAWKPIETAPKDGSMILICLPRQMNIVVRAWYNKIHNFWLTDYEGEGGITRPTYFHEGDLWHPIPPLYATPQQRTWVGLTDEKKYALADDVARRGVPVFEAICEAEAKLKEKNGA
jgi:hypothetical protein